MIKILFVCHGRIMPNCEKCLILQDKSDFDG